MGSTRVAEPGNAFGHRHAVRAAAGLLGGVVAPVVVAVAILNFGPHNAPDSGPEDFGPLYGLPALTALASAWLVHPIGMRDRLGGRSRLAVAVQVVGLCVAALMVLWALGCGFLMSIGVIDGGWARRWQ